MADWRDEDELKKYSLPKDDKNYHFESIDFSTLIYDHVTNLSDLEEYEPNLQYRTPETLRDFKEIQEIAKAAEPELRLLMERLLRWHYNIFPTVATEDGIKEWENWLDVVRTRQETLEDRRLRIITKLNERLPYTWIQLHRMLAGVCGWGGYEVTLNELELKCSLSMDSASQLSTVIELLQRVLPQYIVWMVSQYSKAGSSLYYGGVTREVKRIRWERVDISDSF